MKNVSEMTQAEIEQAAAKLVAQQAKRKEYSKNRKATMTPEQKQARLDYGKRKRENEKAILAKARELGVVSAPVSAQPRIAKPNKK